MPGQLVQPLPLPAVGGHEHVEVDGSAHYRPIVATREERIEPGGDLVSGEAVLLEVRLARFPSRALARLLDMTIQIGAAARVRSS